MYLCAENCTAPSPASVQIGAIGAIGTRIRTTRIISRSTRSMRVCTGTGSFEERGFLETFARACAADVPALASSLVSKPSEIYTATLVEDLQEQIKVYPSYLFCLACARSSFLFLFLLSRHTCFFLSDSSFFALLISRPLALSSAERLLFLDLLSLFTCFMASILAFCWLDVRSRHSRTTLALPSVVEQASIKVCGTLCLPFPL